ncbi:MAG TPA: MFS transporter [Burkholderiales bacterium]|nr:MFS transporter [Burkholderiales bacterium]
MRLVLACGCLVLFLGFGVRAAFGLFLQPMSLEYGWGREIFSFALALQNLLWGALMPVAGAIADRYGAARVVGAGGVLYVLGLVAMAFADTALKLQLGAGFLIGFALSGTTFGVVLAVIARVAPIEKRSTALGIATAAGSFGQFALLPVSQWLIGWLDWKMALVGLAVLAAGIVPFSAALRGRPAALAGSQSIGAALREAWRERSFHLIFWGYFVCGFQLLMFSVHLPAFVADAGLAPRHGMMALALIGLFNMVGSFICGWLGGRFSKKRLLATIYFLRALIMLPLILFPLSLVTLYSFAVLMGLMWLGTIPLTNGLVGQIFGLRYMAMLTGLVFFGHQIGSFCGIWLAGYLYDTTGSYNGVFMISAALGIFAGLVHLPVNERPISERGLARA